MKRTTIFIILCVVSLFCFAQNGQKDSTITTVQLGDVVVKGRIPEVRTKGAVSKIQVDKTVLALSLQKWGQLQGCWLILRACIP